MTNSSCPGLKMLKDHFTRNTKNSFLLEIENFTEIRFSDKTIKTTRLKKKPNVDRSHKKE